MSDVCLKKKKVEKKRLFYFCFIFRCFSVVISLDYNGKRETDGFLLPGAPLKFIFFD